MNPDRESSPFAVFGETKDWPYQFRTAETPTNDTAVTLPTKQNLRLFQARPFWCSMSQIF